MEILVVVDMQNDFVDGALGTKEAVEIVPKVAEKIRLFKDGTNSRVLYTRDTHEENYLDTQEGRHLPVRHCIRGTQGWEICPEIELLRKEQPIDKPTFGSPVLGQLLKAQDEDLKKQGERGNYIGNAGRALHRYLCDFKCFAGEGISTGNSGDCRCQLLCRSYGRKPSKCIAGYEYVSDSDYRTINDFATLGIDQTFIGNVG